MFQDNDQVEQRLENMVDFQSVHFPQREWQELCGCVYKVFER